jgi:hypothetical protein
VADHHVAGRHRRPEVADELAEERHQLVFVECHDLFRSISA